MVSRRFAGRSAAALSGLFLALCGAFFCCSDRLAVAADPPLRPWLEQPLYRHSHWGLLLQDLATGETLCELNADKFFIPASTTKLFSTACALDAFGADHRFVTPVVRRGEVDADGALQGDLILVASGDPTFGGRTLEGDRIAFTDHDHTYANGSRDTQLTAPDPLAGLHALAAQVRAAGVRRVTGDVLIDDRLFDRAESSGSGPTRVTPIMINDNLIDLVVEPTEAGRPARIRSRPETNAVRIGSVVETTAADQPTTIAVRDHGQGRYFISGRIAQASAPVTHVVEASDPASHARTLFIEALEKAGVAVDSSPLIENSPLKLPPYSAQPTLPVVASHRSPPLGEELKLILKVSHNLHASTLPLLVASKHGERTLGAGLRRQQTFLRSIGVDVGGLSFAGGAGGARADHLTPRSALQLLRAMAKRPDFDVYRNALPILGVDGTLAQAVGPNSPARGKAQAKTGTLLWHDSLNDAPLLTSKALAGYLVTASGRQTAFALFVNHVPLRDGATAKTVGQDLGAVVEALHAAY